MPDIYTEEKQSWCAQRANAQITATASCIPAISLSLSLSLSLRLYFPHPRG